jgi:putative hydrolase of the HAD superfamily
MNWRRWGSIFHTKPFRNKIAFLTFYETIQNDNSNTGSKGEAMIKAVIFDFGRVISSQKPPSLFREYEVHLKLAPGMINQIMFNSQAWQDALIGRLTAEGFWSAIGPELGLDSREKIRDFRRRYHRDESINGGVINLIRQLCGRYKLAVLSNSPPGLAEWLSDWEILDLFDVVFCSGDEGIIKPNPLAYHTTLKRLGVLPHEAVFVDDTIGHVQAAQKLGVHGILFTTAEKLAPELTHLLDLQKNQLAE